MKKLFVLLPAILLGTCGPAFAQGTVAFNNLGNANWRLWTNNVTLTASNLCSSTLANGYRIGLYVGSSVGSLQLVGVAMNTSPFGPGTFQGGTPFTLTNFPGGTPVVFQIRGWSFAGGASYETALSAATSAPLEIALGMTALGTVTPAGIGAPPSPLWGTTPGLLTRGFEMAPIPEPSSIVLGVLGLGTIFLFRRRK